MRFLLLLLTYFISKTIFSQTPFPMLGHVGMRNAEILIHGVRQSDSLTIKLYNSEKILVQTKKAAVNHNLGHTCAIQFSQLTPNSNYLYQFNFHNFQSPLYSFKTQQLWQWRENPPPFTVAFGSCVYVNDSEFDRPGKPYGQSSTIFNSIMNEQPAAMIWGGDNVYFREGDWETATNMAERYVHTRSDSNIKNILMNVPNYAVWDDHDFGPNDSHGGFQFKNESQKVFRTMWPNQGYANFNGMNFGKIELNDIEIYFLDNRFNRTSPKLGKSAQMLGAEQLEWLFNNLVTSKASFKLIVVGSQILNSEAVFETFANYSEERMYVINKLQELNIKNVIFLSGDRHFSECSEINSNSSNRLVDITSSPLTSKPYTNVSEKNLNRVEGSLIQEQNFATFQFSGEDKKRKVLVSFKNSTGTTLWSKSYSMN